MINKKIEQLREQIRKIQENSVIREQDKNVQDEGIELKDQFEVYKSSKKSNKVEFVYLNSSRGSILSPLIMYKRINEYGEYYQKERIYIDHIGEVEISDTKLGLEGFKSYLNNDRHIQLDKCLFLDIETTGLETGCGTIAYMIGLGFFEGSSFTVRQFFLRDFDEEHAFLLSINEYANKYDYLFTYNGKRFDMNILRNRYMMNRISFDLEELLHIDLYRVLKELHKYSKRKLNLKVIENELLGIERKEDLAPNLIPEAYYRYLRKGYSELLEYVFEHNSQDVASLAGIALYLDKAFLQEESYGKLAGEINFYFGKMAYKKNDYIQAKNFYGKAINYDINQKIYSEIFHDLYRIYKKEKDYDNIMNLLIDFYARLPEKINSNKLKKIAIYFEKDEKDLAKALYFAVKYMDRDNIKGKDFVKRIFKKMLKEVNN